jgi:hypothetical protein
MTAVQRETPSSLVGRVAATANTLIFVPNALTLLFGATLVSLLDHRVVLVGTAALGVATATYCLTPASPLRLSSGGRRWRSGTAR